MCVQCHIVLRTVPGVGIGQAVPAQRDDGLSRQNNGFSAIWASAELEGIAVPSRITGNYCGMMGKKNALD